MKEAEGEGDKEGEGDEEGEEEEQEEDKQGQSRAPCNQRWTNQPTIQQSGL